MTTPQLCASRLLVVSIESTAATQSRSREISLAAEVSISNKDSHSPEFPAWEPLFRASYASTALQRNHLPPDQRLLECNPPAGPPPHYVILSGVATFSFRKSCLYDSRHEANVETSNTGVILRNPGFWDDEEYPAGYGRDAADHGVTHAYRPCLSIGGVP